MSSLRVVHKSTGGIFSKRSQSLWTLWATRLATLGRVEFYDSRFSRYAEEGMPEKNPQAEALPRTIAA